jgi:GH15 family glucan-1,4-alpha-glucosidase
MDKVMRLVSHSLFLMPVLCVPASSLAQSPVDGTWRINMDQSKISSKPIMFSVNKGMYECTSCSPRINVKADGQDQSVTGQSYDTISVREVDPKSIVITTKKSGKTVREETMVVSDDGNTLAVKIAFHPRNSDQTVSEEITATRVGKAPIGANGTSGSWRNSKVKDSENGLLFTYKSTGDELRMSTAAGESYTAKLDGKDYPFNGSYDMDSVSVKRVDDRTVEETSKLDGKIVSTWKMTVASDGKKMKIVLTNKLTGQTSTYVAEKQ